MPRRRNLSSPIYPFHIYNRSIDKEFYPLTRQVVWSKIVDYLRICHFLYGVRIHAFVLMSNHYHLLATFPDENMAESIGFFQREFSKWMLSQTGYQRYRFSGRFKSSMILDPNHYFNVYRYIYNNPRRAGLCQRAEAYPFSTLSFRNGVVLESPPLDPRSPLAHLIPDELTDENNLINIDFCEDEITQIKNGLKRVEFNID